MPTSSPKVAVMASGSGTNAENLLAYAQNKNTFKITCVITDKEDAGVISRCEKFGTDCFVVPVLKEENAKKKQEEKILRILKENSVDWIFLAGYMRILSQDFIDSFWNQATEKSNIINIHPALLPQFPGKDAYEQAYEAGVKESGITVHHVDAGIDTGPIILQEKFNRREDDSLESFKARGLEVEYKLYKKAVDHLFNGENLI